jgi:hypothetical protein
MKGIIEMQIHGTAASPQAAVGAYQAEQELVARIKELRDKSLEVNRLEFGQLLIELQKMYAKSGRHGQFGKRIEELGFVRATVYRWMDEYKTQVSHRKSKGGVIQAGEKELSHLRQLSTQAAQNEAVAANSCGTSDGAHDTWDELASPAPSEAPRTEGPVVNPFDTPEKRKAFMFQHAVRALQAGNVYTESLREEWNEVDQRVRQWLASFAVDNAVPAHDVYRIQQQEREG